MNKHKILLIVLVLVFTFSSVAVADYVGSGSLSANTLPVLKTGPNGVARLYDKIGVSDGGSTIPSNNLLANGSYAGNGVGDKGVYPDSLVVTGVTNIKSAVKSLDLIVMNQKQNLSFDQYTTPGTFNFKFTNGSSIDLSAKPLEAVVPGRYISSLVITDKAGLNIKSSNYNSELKPKYTLELQPTASFKPTTNIGLGDKCDLYPSDLGVNSGDGRGCPMGSFLSYYKAPSLSGVVTSTNNTNTQIAVFNK